MSDVHQTRYTTNLVIPRPSRRPCAAVPLKCVPATANTVTTPTTLSTTSPSSSALAQQQRQPSPPSSERSVSPLTVSPPLPHQVGALGAMTIPMIYERMNTLMLEMNVLMARWDAAMAGAEGGMGAAAEPARAFLPASAAGPPMGEAFKSMLNAFGNITMQYSQFTQNGVASGAPSTIGGARKPTGSAVITTVVQQSGGNYPASSVSNPRSSGTVSPDLNHHHHHHHQHSANANQQQQQQPRYHSASASATPSPSPQSSHNSNNSPNICNNNSRPFPLPVAAADSAAGADLLLEKDCIVAVVEFKRQRMKRFACAQFVEPGQYVIVDGDRGKDCGFVVYCSVRNADGSHGLTQCIENARIDVNRIKIEPGIVLGLASEEDINLLHGEIATSERMALKICRELVEQMELPMKVVDCEYQFDRRKISFYFESSRSIDFRTLTTELYRIFGVRIWLENQNNKVKNVVPDGAFSQNDKSSFSHRNSVRTPATAL